MVELETEAKNVFGEFLTAMKYKDIERFFNEWKMTFKSDGPFTSEQDLGNLEKAMTDPDDFMVGTFLKRSIKISQWCVGEKNVNFPKEISAIFTTDK